MQSFEQRVEALTQLALTSSSAPSLDDLTQYLRDSVKDLIRKSVARGGKLLHMFAKKETITGATGLETDGALVLSVLRGDGTILNPANEISPNLKGRIGDVDSLYYASKYNPVFYIEENKIYIKPDPTTGTTDYGEITHVVYDGSLNYASINITNFPESAEYLVALNAAAMCCLVKANSIHNNLPTVPTFTKIPNYNYDSVSLPSFPIYSPPGVAFDTSDIKTQLNNDDLDLADKHSELLEKEMSRFEKDLDVSNERFSKALEEFTSELQRKRGNADKELETIINQYGSDVKKFEAEMQNYSATFQKSVTQYNWWMTQYSNLLNEYNSGIMSLFGKKPSAQTPQQEQAYQQGAAE